MATSLIFWPAAAAVLPTATAPAVKFRAGTNIPTITLAFDGADGSQDEQAFFIGVIPDVYGGGNIIYRIYWEPDTGAPASENCSWDVLTIGRIDDEAFDTAPGESQTVNDVVTTAGDLQVASTAAAALTVAAGDLVVLKVNRDYDEANGGTALGEDALLHGIQMLEE